MEWSYKGSKRSSWNKLSKSNQIYNVKDNIIMNKIKTYMGEDNSSYFPSSLMYVLYECALPHSLAQDLSFHTVRWEQGTGCNYSTRWDETIKVCAGLLPYRSRSTRLLRTGEEKQHERQMKAYNNFQFYTAEHTANMLHSCQTYTGLLVHHENTEWAVTGFVVQVETFFTACVNVKWNQLWCCHSQAAWSHHVKLHNVNTVTDSFKTHIQYSHTHAPHLCYCDSDRRS